MPLIPILFAVLIFIDGYFLPSCDMNDTVICTRFSLVEFCCSCVTIILLPPTFQTVTKAAESVSNTAFKSKTLSALMWNCVSFVLIASAEFSPRTGQDVICAGQLLFRLVTSQAATSLCPCQTRQEQNC